MNVQKISLYYHTLKYIKSRQIAYRIFYKLRNKVGKKDFSKKMTKEVKVLACKEMIPSPESFKAPASFSFLNLAHHFQGEIDWNYAEFGKLWTYNLNYFDFLNQSSITKEEGLALMKAYLSKNLKDGLEPYPISLRGINWVKFFSAHKIDDLTLQQALYDHYQILFHNIEYHLLGNHLLENGLSLLFGAYYFQDDFFLKRAVSILKSELKEQILADGAHFELSPMYHNIILHRLLDCYNIQQNNRWKEDGSVQIIEETIPKMLGWLSAIVYKNGEIPMLNDSAYDISASPQALFHYANHLGLKWNKTPLEDSGYRKWENEVIEMVMDIGKIGPDYIPGHAHADTFNFELRIQGKPFIVDPGISTYEKNARRQWERSSEAHNTVLVNNMNQSNIWGGFRVAERARIIALNENQSMIKASHDGYKKIGTIHERTFEQEQGKISISDQLTSNQAAKAVFHFHPDIQQIEIRENSVFFPQNGTEIHFDGQIGKISKSIYSYCMGYNKTIPGNAVEVSFTHHLSTQINYENSFSH